MATFLTYRQKAQKPKTETDPANSFRLFAATGQGLEKSENGGRSWSAVLIDGKHDEVFALAVDPASPDTLFAGRRDGLWRSEDGGQSWTAWSHPGSVPLSIAIAKGQPKTLYLATSRRGVYKSTDGGNQWTEVNRGLPEARAGGRTEEIHTLVVDPSDSNIAYAASARYGLYRTVDGGTSWHEFNPGLSSARPILPPRLVFDPDDPRRLYLAFNERIHSHLIKPRLYVLSENQKWLPVEAILPSNFYILDLVVDRVEAHWQEHHRPIIVAREVADTARFGRLELRDDTVSRFSEKGVAGPGLINAGCYVLPPHALNAFPLGQAFSLETDFLANAVRHTIFDCFVSHGHFVDIGEPKDYARAQQELAVVLS